MDRTEVKEMVKAFEVARVRLSKQVAAKAELEFASEVSADVDLIVVAGPTGVGKSTILLEYAVEYLASRRKEMQANASLHPLAIATAVASGDLLVDWVRLYRDILASLDDPFANFRTVRRDGRKALAIYKGETPSAALLREQVESVFAAQGTERCIIDEAHHIIRGKGPGKPGDRLDMLKSQAQTSGAKLVLAGTHDLPTYLSHSGQLARRCFVIRLNRYRFDNKKELTEFASACAAMFKALPSRPTYPDVAKNITTFFVGSIGCPGVLKNWIARAYMRSLKAGQNEIKFEDMIETRLSGRALRTINAEVVESERTQDEDKQGPGPELVKAILQGMRYGTISPPKEKTVAKRANSSETKPFTRTRVRDTVQ